MLDKADYDDEEMQRCYSVLCGSNVLALFGREDATELETGFRVQGANMGKRKETGGSNDGAE